MRNEYHASSCAAGSAITALCVVTALQIFSGTVALATGSHAGQDAVADAGGPSSSEVPRVPVTRDQVERFGIKIAVAEKGSVPRELRIPGELRVNADRVAHVVPQASGVVREVVATLGDTNDGGAVLAWIESDELADAKLAFCAKESDVARCELELPRAEAIYKNVGKLIVLLKEKREPTAEAIAALDGLEMGAYRGQLLTAHAAYRAAQTTHAREAQLRAKEFSSGQDFLTAETRLRQAHAELLAALDTARYETLLAYTNAARKRQVAALNSVTAEHALRLKGADDALIASLRAVVSRTAGTEPRPHDDPNGREGTFPPVRDIPSEDGRFAWYALRSPFRGTVIEKHIAQGESLDRSSEVFTIADLSSVWVDLAVSQEAVPAVRKGLPVTIRFPDGASAEAQIGFVSPTIDPETRTALARAVLENEGGNFRPGTFVEATIRIAGAREAIVIPKASVQLVYDHPCVFVWKSGAFELREVVTGAADGTRIEIVQGLDAGEKVAAVNAFHLKAEFIKSAAGDPGAHQGHSH